MVKINYYVQVRGTITYSDIFDEEHKVQWCWLEPIASSAKNPSLCLSP